MTLNADAFEARLANAPKDQFAAKMVSRRGLSVEQIGVLATMDGIVAVLARLAARISIGPEPEAERRDQACARQRIRGRHRRAPRLLHPPP